MEKIILFCKSYMRLQRYRSGLFVCLFVFSILMSHLLSLQFGFLQLCLLSKQNPSSPVRPQFPDTRGDTRPLQSVPVFMQSQLVKWVVLLYNRNNIHFSYSTQRKSKGCDMCLLKLNYCKMYGLSCQVWHWTHHAASFCLKLCDLNVSSCTTDVSWYYKCYFNTPYFSH